MENFDPTKVLDATKWSSLNINDLIAQKTILQTRYWQAVDLGNLSIQQQLKRGVDSLDIYIKTRERDDANDREKIRKSRRESTSGQYPTG